MLSGSIQWEQNPDEEFVLRIRPPKGRIIPEETVAHMKAANREMLLALRSLIDAALEKQDKAENKKGKRRTKIEVE
jgi:hypothetical protein